MFAFFRRETPTASLTKVLKEIQKKCEITQAHEQAVIKALEGHANPATTTEISNNILHLSILYGTEKFVCNIITLINDKGALNQQDALPYAKNTPLLLAIKRGMYSAAQMLVDKGIDMDIVDWRQFTALHYACGALGLDYHKANPDKTHDKSQQLVSLIHKMLEYGADPRKLNVYQHAPLELLQEELAPLDFELYQETLPYRIARVLNLPPDLTIQWCKNEEPRDQTKFDPINKLYAEYQQAQKFFDSLSSNQSRTDEEINEERVAVHRKYGNALKVFKNILVDNMFLFTVGMIKRNHLYGAQKRWDIHELERKGIFERAKTLGYGGEKARSIEIFPGLDDFMDIADSIEWHRKVVDKDTIIRMLTNSRYDFHKDNAQVIKELVSHLQSTAQVLNQQAPSSEIKQSP